jgi:hypothetical protein
VNPVQKETAEDKKLENNVSACSPSVLQFFGKIPKKQKRREQPFLFISAAE